MKLKLTDLAVRQLATPARGQRSYFEADGFGVRVSQGGTKTFVVVRGKQRKWTTIGRYPDMSLKEARQAARLILPPPEPTAPPRSVSEAIAAFLALKEQTCRPGTLANYRLYLNRIKKTAFEDIRKEDLTYSPHATAAAKAFFNWCVREEIVEKNPVQYVPVKLRQRSRVLTDAELKAIWHYEAPPFTDHIKMLILTGQRRSQFSNYEIRDDTLFFPADIMKGKEDHVVPLLPMARAIAGRVKPFRGWSKAKARLDKAVSIPPWVIHDLRRTFSTKMAALRVPLHVTEKILAHRSGTISGVAAIYNRYDFLKEAEEALALYEAHLAELFGHPEVRAAPAPHI
jgi:integrase